MEGMDSPAVTPPMSRLSAVGQLYVTTVGAVALDCLGNLAAATSTGGMTNKLFGRVGDSAIIGASTYAERAERRVRSLLRQLRESANKENRQHEHQ